MGRGEGEGGIGGQSSDAALKFLHLIGSDLDFSGPTDGFPKFINQGQFLIDRSFREAGNMQGVAAHG